MQFPEPTDDTSRRILDAALKCFTQTPIRKVTMNRIADEAGLGVATVYRRFPQKEQLVQAVALREASRFIDEVGSGISSESTVEGQLAEGFTAFVIGMSRRPLLLDSLRGDPEIALPMVTAHGAPLLAIARNYLAATIRGWQGEHLVAAFDADVVAEIYARLALSLLLTPDGTIPTHDHQATREFARTYLLRLLKPATP